ncbi:hypothetical protein [Bradyrhizobium sp. ORS 86]|uniref:hypothetical protein n=1 Tax=Bradyrhizobium sp. ORS 86 TaxID=1685970 RepID=UPI003890CA05
MFAATETSPAVLAVPASSNSPSRNPFEVARSALIKRLVDIEVPRELSLRTRPLEFSALADHIREAANIFDEWLFAIGTEVADNANRTVDLRLFTGAFLGAVDGNATYATETAPFASDEEGV